MEQLWLALSPTSLVTGFGLLVALLLLKRLTPIPLPPVIEATVALLLMGVASFGGIYLRVLELPRSMMAYRLINAGAWGFAAFALISFVAAGRARKRDGRKFSGVTVKAKLMAGAGGVLIFGAALLGAHPAAGTYFARVPLAQAILISTVEVIVGFLAVWSALLALRWGGDTGSRPWRAYLRGFGIAVLLLIPANLVDFAVTTLLRLRGSETRDGFIFAAGYALAGVVLIAALIRSFRLSADRESIAVPHTFIDAYGISRREKEVVEKLVEGKSDRKIAEELYISPRTVDSHLGSVYRKCAVNSRLQLTQLVSHYGELRNSR